MSKKGAFETIFGAVMRVARGGLYFERPEMARFGHFVVRSSYCHEVGDKYECHFRHDEDAFLR